MEYIRRIIDDELNKRQEAFNAINIIGPKGCGKTRTAKERCNTVIEFQDEEKTDTYQHLLLIKHINCFSIRKRIS